MKAYKHIKDFSPRLFIGYVLCYQNVVRVHVVHNLWLFFWGEGGKNARWMFQYERGEDEANKKCTYRSGGGNHHEEKHDYVFCH